MNHPTITQITRGIYEPDYALILDCTGLDGPEYRHGQHLLFSKSAPTEAGDLCAIEFVNGHRHLVYLETVLPENVLASLPYVENTRSTVVHTLIATALGDESGKSLCIKASNIKSVHRCVGWYAADVEARA